MNAEHSAQRRSPGLTLATLRGRGLLEELAKVFDSEAAARGLLERAEVPPERIVPFGQTRPIEFWGGVCRELEKGLTAGGLAALFRAAAEEYPHNEIFQDGLRLVTPDGDGSPPPDSGTVAARSWSQEQSESPRSTASSVRPSRSDLSMSSIFISYAHEDIAIAYKLYSDLKHAGLKPWLDTEDLVPGQRWKLTIRSAIQNSAYVLVLISRNSLSKRGFYQKELRLAMDTLSDLPPDAIYVVPVRLDDTKPIHDELRELHWVDLFPSYEKGFERILETMRRSRDSRSLAQEDDLPFGVTDQDEHKDSPFKKETHDNTILGTGFTHTRSARPQRGPSPFVVGTMIENDEGFFGRERQKKLLRQAIKHGQHVQVLSKLRMGKTSLLRWVQRHASVWQNRPAVWINAQGLVAHSPEALILAVAEGLGKGPEAEEAMASDGAVKVLKDLLPLLLLVDDAAALAKPGHGFDAQFLEALRQFGQERQLIWVSSSDHDLRQLFDDTGTGSPFLNDGRVAWVGQLGPAAARSLVARLDDDNLVELAIEYAGGFAYGLQWLADSLWEDASDQEVTCDEFCKAMEYYFRRWWEPLSDKHRGLLRRCVDEVPKSELTTQDRRRARPLVNLGFLAEKEGNFVVPGIAWRDFLADEDRLD